MPLTPAEPTFSPDAVSLFLARPLTVIGCFPGGTGNTRTAGVGRRDGAQKGRREPGEMMMAPGGRDALILGTQCAKKLMRDTRSLRMNLTGTKTSP